MKKILKILILISFAFLFLVKNNYIFAQGTCSVDNNCGIKSPDNCDSGYEPSNIYCGPILGLNCRCLLIEEKKRIENDFINSYGQGAARLLTKKAGAGKQCVVCPSNYSYNTDSKKCVQNDAIPSWVVFIPGTQVFTAPITLFNLLTPKQIADPTGYDSSLCEKELFCYQKTGTCEDPDNLNNMRTLQPESCVVGATGGKFSGSDAALDKSLNGIQTALGCIPTDPNTFIKVFLNWAIGLAGGIAFIFMLFAAFQILTSQGNPETLKAGQEQLTAAVIGLLFIIFSVFLLRIVGLPIMNISL